MLNLPTNQLKSDEELSWTDSENVLVESGNGNKLFLLLAPAASQRPGTRGIKQPCSL